MTRERLASRLVAAKFPIFASNQMYSSLIGNVKQIIKSLFPRDYFKTTYVRNSVAAVTEHHLNDDDKLVKDLPALSILLNYEPQDSSFSGDPFVHMNMMTFRTAWDQKIYDHPLSNFNEKVFISAMSYRIAHSFEIGIHVNTNMQALNVMGYLHSKIGGDKGNKRRMFYNNFFMELPIPMSIMGSLAKAKDKPITNMEEFIEFGNYVKKISNGNIVFKKHSTSNKYLFFYKYPVNFFTTIDSVSVPEETKEGKVVMGSNVKINMTLEYNTYNTFVLESYQNLPPIDLSDYMTDTDVGVTLHYALQFKYSEQLPDGRKCVFSEEFITDEVRGESNLDSTSFYYAIDPHVRSYLTKMYNEIDEEIFYKKIYTILLYDGYEMEYGKDKDYYIDWNTLELHINDPQLNSDYKLYIYCDTHEIIELSQRERESVPFRTNSIIERKE